MLLELPLLLLLLVPRPGCWSLLLISSTEHFRSDQDLRRRKLFRSTYLFLFTFQTF